MPNWNGRGSLVSTALMYEGKAWRNEFNNGTMPEHFAPEWWCDYAPPPGCKHDGRMIAYRLMRRVMSGTINVKRFVMGRPTPPVSPTH